AAHVERHLRVAPHVLRLGPVVGDRDAHDPVVTQVVGDVRQLRPPVAPLRDEHAPPVVAKQCQSALEVHVESNLPAPAHVPSALLAGALPVAAARPATGPAHAVLQLLLGPPNATLPGLVLLGVLDP